MATRILRDWTDSEAIDFLSCEAERFFVRLIMKADDFGKFSANPQLLKSLLFPLKKNIKDSEIKDWLVECQKAGLLVVYSAENKTLLKIIKFEQRLRNMKSKFPDPPSIEIHDVAISCDSETETVRNPPQSAADCRKSPPETKRRETKDATPDGSFVLPIELDTDQFKQSWQKYLAYRKERRLPKLKPMSIQANMAEMKEWGAAVAIDAINKTIAANWQGIFRPKELLNAPKQKRDLW